MKRKNHSKTQRTVYNSGCQVKKNPGADQAIRGEATKEVAKGNSWSVAHSQQYKVRHIVPPLKESAKARKP
jgi:hypothetical protein